MRARSTGFSTSLAKCPRSESVLSSLSLSLSLYIYNARANMSSVQLNPLVPRASIFTLFPVIILPPFPTRFARLPSSML